MPRGSTVVDLGPPEQGARSDVAPHRLPPEAVPADATRNVTIRDGFLVNRPGLNAFNATALEGRPMGGILFKTGASTFTVVGTTTKLYKLNTAGTGWDNLTGATALTGTATDPIRFAVFPSGGSNHLIATNRANLMQTWNGVAGTFSNLAGASLYRAGDITTAANRVVIADTVESGTAQQYRVRWSDFNNHEGWSTNNFADLSDTDDVVVGARALSRVAFAIYKEASQWVGLAQSGLFPFKFELQDLKPGPVSPVALVVAEGRHYYLATDGSIYVFDGIRTTHVGEPIRRFVGRNFTFDQARRAFGVYLRRDREIYWFFPAIGTDDPAMAVSLNVDSGRYWPHEFRRSVSCGFTGDAVSEVSWDSLSAFTWDNIAATYPTWNAFGSASIPVEVLGGTGGTIYRIGFGATDDGLSPTAKWRFQNLQPAGASKRGRVQSCDTFFEDPGASLTVTMKVGTTDTLGADPTFPAELTDTFNIDTDELHQANYDTDSPGVGTGLPEARFVSVHHEIVTSVDWKWGGAHLRVYPLETS